MKSKKFNPLGQEANKRLSEEIMVIASQEWDGGDALQLREELFARETVKSLGEEILAFEKKFLTTNPLDVRSG